LLRWGRDERLQRFFALPNIDEAVPYGITMLFKSAKNIQHGWNWQGGIKRCSFSKKTADSWQEEK
jgi:hypothetical protein